MSGYQLRGYCIIQAQDNYSLNKDSSGENKMEENDKKYGKTDMFAGQVKWFTFRNSEFKENMPPM